MAFTPGAVRQPPATFLCCHYRSWVLVGVGRGTPGPVCRGSPQPSLSLMDGPAAPATHRGVHQAHLAYRRPRVRPDRRGSHGLTAGRTPARVGVGDLLFLATVSLSSTQPKGHFTKNTNPPTHPVASPLIQEELCRCGRTLEPGRLWPVAELRQSPIDCEKTRFAGRGKKQD